MTVCRFCGGEVRDKDKICLNCGYNPKTDTIDPDFVRQEQKGITGKKKSLVSPGVKNFVFWGIVIIVLSLIFKYQAKLGDVIWQVRSFKAKQFLGKDNEIKAIKLLDVGSFKAPVGKLQRKNKKIEGIFYDPKNKSYVVINSQLVSEGESFGGMLIKTINRDSVEVVEDGNVKILR